MIHAIRLLMCFSIVGAGVGLVALLADEELPSSKTEDALADQWSPRADPAKVEGHATCVDCHKQEVKAWLTTKHATRAFDLLRTADSAREYAEKLGIRPQDIARNSICTNCHGTKQLNPAGRLHVIGGISCEACHGASGGEEGWLNRHAVYGPPGTRRAQETDEHYAQRRAACRQAGQAGSSELYQLVKRCFQCHVVPDEALAEAGHDHGDRFTLVDRMLGEVRHNFLLDGTTNAEVASLWTDPLHHGPGRTAAGRKRVLFVLAQLVDLEVSLRNIATATQENDFSDLMLDRIEEAFELLSEDLLEELEETELPEVEQAIAAVEPVWEKLDDDGFNPDDKNEYLAAADEVAQAAKTFSARDGNLLAEIDDLDVVPEGPFTGFFQP